MQFSLKFSDPDLSWTGTIQISAVGSPTPVRVDYYIDGISQASSSSSPFYWSLDTTTLSNGTHIVEGRATYRNGRIVSASKSVSVINGSPPADSTPPTVPGSFAKVSDELNSITVSWTASTDAVGVVGYNLYKNGSFVATVADDVTSYLFEGLNCGTTYTLSVEAFDARGNKSAKSTIMAATEDCAVPVIPTITSSIESNDTVTQGDTWTVTTDPDVEKVEFWADGIKLGESTSEPHQHVISLSPSVHKLGIVVTYQDVRIPYGSGGVYASNVTVLAAPTPPPPQPPVITSNIKDGMTIKQGDSWIITTDPDSSFVEFWADGTRFATSVEPFQAQINLSPGTHRLGVCVTSNGQRYCYGSGGVYATVTVLSSAVFSASQNISNGQVLSGSPTWVVTASGKEAVKVEFYIDGSLKSTDTTSPFGYTIDTVTLSNGTHSLFAKAYAADGSVATTPTVSVTISNVTPTPGVTSFSIPRWRVNLTAGPGAGSNGRVAIWRQYKTPNNSLIDGSVPHLCTPAPNPRNPTGPRSWEWWFLGSILIPASWPNGTGKSFATINPHNSSYDVGNTTGGGIGWGFGSGVSSVHLFFIEGQAAPNKENDLMLYTDPSPSTNYVPTLVNSVTRDHRYDIVMRVIYGRLDKELGLAGPGVPGGGIGSHPNNGAGRIWVWIDGTLVKDTGNINNLHRATNPSNGKTYTQTCAHRPWDGAYTTQGLSSSLSMERTATRIGRTFLEAVNDGANGFPLYKEWQDAASNMNSTTNLTALNSTDFVYPDLF